MVIPSLLANQPATGSWRLRCSKQTGNIVTLVTPANSIQQHASWTRAAHGSAPVACGSPVLRAKLQTVSRSPSRQLLHTQTGATTVTLEAPLTIAAAPEASVKSFEDELCSIGQGCLPGGLMSHPLADWDDSWQQTAAGPSGASSSSSSSIHDTSPISSSSGSGCGSSSDVLDMANLEAAEPSTYDVVSEAASANGATAISTQDSKHSTGTSSSSSSIVGVPVGVDSGDSGNGAGSVPPPAVLKAVYLASAATKGLRNYMEDYHFTAALHQQQGVQQGPAARGGVEVVSGQLLAAAGVFDGHAGKTTADFAALHTPQLLHQALTGSGPAMSGLPRVLAAPGVCLDPAAAAAASLAGFDKWWGARYGRDRSGSTAVLGVIKGQELTVANTGDSAAVLARHGAAVRLSVDHRADNAAEMLRVIQAGGAVDYDAQGTLRLYKPSDEQRQQGCMFTRSLGDFSFKVPHPLLTCEPHVVQQHLSPSDRLLLLSSDGVTDGLSDDDMVEVAFRALDKAAERTDNQQELAQAVATEVMIAALEGGSADNVTTVTMLLHWE